jgi:hypothetical protein
MMISVVARKAICPTVAAVPQPVPKAFTTSVGSANAATRTVSWAGRESLSLDRCSGDPEGRGGLEVKRSAILAVPRVR